MLDFKLSHRVLNVVCILLGNSLVSEFYMPTFQNTVCSIFKSTYYPEESIQYHKFTYKTRIENEYVLLNWNILSAEILLYISLHNVQDHFLY